MQEKYYIDIDSNRKITGRYLLSFHGENIPVSAQEVSQEVFNTSIQENHNYLNEDLTTEIRDMRTVQEIAEEESLAKEKIELAKAQKLTEFYEIATELGLV